MRAPIIYCADIGSVATGRFAWARGNQSGDSLAVIRDTDIHTLVRLTAQDLDAGLAVAMGFECPLFVPVDEQPGTLTRARLREGSRPWSAAAGAASLAIGLTQTVWILDHVRRQIHSAVSAFLSWAPFLRAENGLFLWEAFVTSGAKGETDMDDAEIAVRCFWSSLSNLENANAIPETNVHSLIGAALLRTGWSEDQTLLETPCIVIKAESE